MIDTPKIVITNNKPLVEYLKSMGYIDDSVPIAKRATEENVSGMHVFGIVPFNLAPLTSGNLKGRN